MFLKKTLSRGRLLRIHSAVYLVSILQSTVHCIHSAVYIVSILQSTLYPFCSLHCIHSAVCIVSILQSTSYSFCSLHYIHSAVYIVSILQSPLYLSSNLHTLLLLYNHIHLSSLPVIIIMFSLDPSCILPTLQYVPSPSPLPHSYTL